jgi:hypothetical protein
LLFGVEGRDVCFVRGEWIFSRRLRRDAVHFVSRLSCDHVMWSCGNPEIHLSTRLRTLVVYVVRLYDVVLTLA